MTISLEAPRRVGMWCVAALVETTRSDAAWIGHFRAKRPVALLLLRDGEVVAFGPTGEPTTIEALRGICPNIDNRLAELREGAGGPQGQGVHGG